MVCNLKKERRTRYTSLCHRCFSFCFWEQKCHQTQWAGLVYLVIQSYVHEKAMHVRSKERGANKMCKPWKERERKMLAIKIRDTSFDKIQETIEWCFVGDISFHICWGKATQIHRCYRALGLRKYLFHWLYAGLWATEQNKPLPFLHTQA